MRPDSRECFWAALKKENVEFKGDSWRYPIPKTEKLDKQSANKIENIFGSSEDHLVEFEEDSEFMNLAVSSSFIYYGVTRKDIENKDIEKLKSFLARITRNEKITLAVQGKLYIGTCGYEDDKREVYQIKTIRKWVKKARNKIDSWYLCASGGYIPSTIACVVACTSDIETKSMVYPDGRSGYQIEGKPKEYAEFVSERFDGINKASDKWDWPTSGTIRYQN